MSAALAHDFRQRAAPAALPERMDGETDYETFRDTVASLASVNRLTMGYRPLAGFLARYTDDARVPVPLRVLDVGSGYGDGVRYAARCLERAGYEGEVVGVDLNPHAARAAEAVTPRYEGVTVRYVTADVFDHVRDAAPYDLVVSALFTHHLEDDAVVRFVRWMDDTARMGWLINDLYRSKLAAAGFGMLATALRRHPYVRHDGPVSFARSFRRDDWRRVLKEAGVTDAEVFIGAPFRLCVTKNV